MFLNNDHIIISPVPAFMEMVLKITCMECDTNMQLLKCLFAHARDNSAEISDNPIKNIRLKDPVLGETVETISKDEAANYNLNGSPVNAL